MKRAAAILLLAATAAGMPLGVQAQKKNVNAYHPDSYYLAGAVPEVDGKVVFSKTFSIPGMARQEVFEKTKAWMESHMKANKNNSAVTYNDPATGEIAAVGNEYIVFTNSALALDRTKVLYQMIAHCGEETCQLLIRNIYYDYPGEKEKLSANEWINDDMALNKDRTKLSRGMAKFRRKTVDWVDDMNESLLKVLNGMDKSAMATQEEATKVRNTAEITVVQNNVSTTQAQAAAGATDGYEAIDPAKLSATAFTGSGGRWVVSIGTDPLNRTTMTAQAGGYLSQDGERTLVYIILTPGQPYQIVEKAADYTVSFYPGNSTKPSVIMNCRNVTTDKPQEGRANTFAGEVTKAEQATQP